MGIMKILKILNFKTSEKVKEPNKLGKVFTIMMKRTMTASEKAQRLLKRTMQNGISTKKLLLLGGVALLALLGITMSGAVSHRRRLAGNTYKVISNEQHDKWPMLEWPLVNDQGCKLPTDGEGVILEIGTASRTVFKEGTVVTMRMEKVKCAQYSNVYDDYEGIQRKYAVVSDGKEEACVLACHWKKYLERENSAGSSPTCTRTLAPKKVLR